MKNFFLSITLPLSKYKHLSYSSIKNQVLGEITKKNVNFYYKDKILVVSNSRILNTDKFLKKDQTKKDDCHVIHKLYCKKKSLLNEINGSYAYVIFDIPNSKIIAACDFFHQRPLYYCTEKNRIFFSTNIDDILNNRPEKYQIDEEIIYDYLVAGMPRKGRTIYKEINIIPNNYFLELNNKNIILNEQVKVEKFEPFNSTRDYSIQLKKIFRNTINKQLSFTSGNVAFTLSGGLDSSSIVCTANQQKKKNKKFHTHSFLYRGLTKKQRFESNEYKYMKSVIKQTDVKPTFHIFKKDGPLKIIDKVTEFSEPILGVNIYVNIEVLKSLNKQKIHYLFEGMGGDNTISHGTGLFYYLGKKLRLVDLLIQYKKYCEYRGREFSIISCIKQFIVLPYIPFLTWVKYELIDKHKINYFNVNNFFKNSHIINVSKRFKLIFGYHQKIINFYSKSAKQYEILSANDGYEAYANRANYIVTNHYNVEQFDPFYNKLLKSFCLNVPFSEKMRDGIDRYYFRESMKSILPKEIYTRNWKGNMSGIFFNELCSYSNLTIEKLICDKSYFFKKIINRDKLRETIIKMKSTQNQRIGVVIYKLIYMSIWLKKRKI